MAARVTYGQRTAAQDSTSSNTYQAKNSFNATPNANKDILWIWSCLRWNTVSTVEQRTRFYNSVSTTVLCECGLQQKDANDILTIYGMAKESFGSSPAQQTYNIGISNSNNSATSNISNMEVVGIELGANDHYAETNGSDVSAPAQTGSGTFNDLVQVQFTGNSEDWYILCYGEFAVNSTSPRLQLQMDINGTPYRVTELDYSVANQYRPWLVGKKFTAGSGTQTVKIQFKLTTSGTPSARRGRIAVMRAADFDAAITAEQETRQTTSSNTTYADVATATGTPANVEHIILGGLLMDYNSTSSSGLCQLIEGATSYGEMSEEPDTVGTADQSCYFMIQRKTLAASSTTWKTQIKAENNGIATGGDESFIWVLQTGSAATQVNNTSDLRWNITGLVSNTVNLRWNIIAAISNALDARWNVLNGVSNSSDLRWNIIQAIANTIDARWNTIAAVNNSSDLRWNVLNEIVQLLEAQWNVLAGVNNSSDLRWNIIAAVAQALDLQWDMEGKVSNAADLRWNLIASIAQAADLRWDVLTTVSQQGDLRWDIVEGISSVADLRWNIIAEVSGLLDARWDTLASVNSSSDLRWNIIAAVAQALNLEWDIDSSTGLVSNALDARWDLIAAVSNSGDFRWNILAAVAQALDARWDVIAAVGNARDLRWNIIAAVAQALDIEWSIIASVLGTADLRWDLLAGVSNSSDARWNILEQIANQGDLRWDMLEGVNKSADLRWDMIAAIAQALDMRWDVLATVNTAANSADLRWNIIAEFSRRLSLRWKMEGREVVVDKERTISPDPDNRTIIIPEQGRTLTVKDERGIEVT